MSNTEFKHNNISIDEDTFVIALHDFLLFKNGDTRSNFRELINILDKAVEYSFDTFEEFKPNLINIDHSTIEIFSANPKIDQNNNYNISVIYNLLLKKIVLLLNKNNNNYYSYEYTFSPNSGDYGNCREFVSRLSRVFDSMAFIHESYDYDIKMYKKSIEE